MYGRRWNSNSPTTMTFRFFIISLYFHALYAESILRESPTAGIAPAFPPSQPSSTAPTDPKATHHSTILISSNPSSPDDQPPKPFQAERSSRKSIGYVAEWEYEGSISPGLDELDESFGTPQVSPLGKGGGGGEGNVANQVEEDDASYPSKRVGPGTWQDSHGSWWLFGGQGPVTPSQGETSTKSISYLSDLWEYDHEKSAWRLVFHPESESSPIHSSYPENLAFPHVCGSEANGHIAVFGGGGMTGTTTNLKTSSQVHNSGGLGGFSDDNIVWLFDIPSSSSSSSKNDSASSSLLPGSQPLDMGWDGSEGLWTSYICCDACLPDGNSTLEFCPRFSREPILWCGQDALMALQISHVDVPEEQHVSTDANNKLVGDAKEKGEKASPDLSPLNGDINGSTSSRVGKNRESNAQAETKSRSNLPEEIISPNGHSTNIRISSTGESPGRLRPERKSPETKTQINTGDSRGPEEAGKSKMSTFTRRSLRATWWKFDLAATEWEKMPEVNVSRRALDLIETGECRTVSDQYMVYILCPSEDGNALERSVLVFDPRRSSIDLVDGRMNLNNAFLDRKVWQLGRSALHALRNDNQMTVLFLAYHKLLDLWIHDHSSNRLVPVENVWKGSSLHAFQRSGSFYKITISFSCNNNTVGESSVSPKNPENAPPSLPDPSGTNCAPKNYSFYMENPRTKLFEFHDYEEHSKSGANAEKSNSWISSGRFHISIVTDQSVFLPARDATFLINPEEEESISSRSATTTTTTTTTTTATSTTTTGSRATSEKSSSRNDLLRSSESTSAIPSTSSISTSSAETATKRKNLGFKPASKIISGKVPLNSRLYNGALQTAAQARSASKSNASITTASSQLRTTTTTTTAPTILSSQVEQKLTLQSKFNLNRRESKEYSPPEKNQQQLQLLPRTRITQNETNRTATTTSSTTTTTVSPIISSTAPPRAIETTSANVNLQSNKSKNETQVQSTFSGMTSIDPQLQQQKQQEQQQPSSLTLLKPLVPVNNSSPPPENSTRGNDHQSTQASSISSSSPAPLSQPPAVITMAPTPTKKPITMPKRIPKGSLLRTMSGRTEARSGKIVNLLPVKKTSLVGADKKEKPIEVDRAHEQENGNVDETRKEITVADPGNESLRSNKIHSWNDSRIEAEARLSPLSPLSPARSSSPPPPSPPVRGDEVPANLKTSSTEETIVTTKSKPTTTPVIPYDDTINVTLSYTVVNEAINTNRITTSRARDSSGVDEQSSFEDEEESERRSNSLTYQASSEVIFENHEAVGGPISESSIVPSMNASYSSMLFFAVSLSIFATFGIVLFVRRCVKCPPRRQSVLIKEPPPIRYSVIPDELSYHTPIV